MAFNTNISFVVDSYFTHSCGFQGSFWIAHMTLNSKVSVKYNVAFNTNISFVGDIYFTHWCADDNEGFGLLI